MSLLTDLPPAISSRHQAIQQNPLSLEEPHPYPLTQDEAKFHDYKYLRPAPQNPNAAQPSPEPHVLPLPWGSHNSFTQPSHASTGPKVLT